MVILSAVEVFNLGVAIGSFSCGNIDQGIHAILPVTDSDTGKKSNQVFQSLFDEYLDGISTGPLVGINGELYYQGVRVWIRDRIPVLTSYFEHE